MAENANQKLIDGLIKTIRDAEAPESVTNEMVARIFDFLNGVCKGLLDRITGLDTERNERQTADAALQATDASQQEAIDTLLEGLSNVTKTANQAKTTATNNVKNITAINYLLEENPTEAIDSLKEVIAFLDGLKDSDTLAALLDTMRQRLDTLDTQQTRQDSKISGCQTRLTEAEQTTWCSNVLNISTIPGPSASNGTGIKFSYPLVTGRVPDYMRGVGRVLTYLNTNNVWETKRFIGTDRAQWEDSTKWEDVYTGVGNLINVTDMFPLRTGAYTLETAIKAVPASLRGSGRWITYRTAKSVWEKKMFRGADVSYWENKSYWEDIYPQDYLWDVFVNHDFVASRVNPRIVNVDVMSHGPLINVTESFPGENDGFYVLGSAVHAVPDAWRFPGCIITYRTDGGKWETKHFIGASLSTWETLSNWEDVFGTGTLTGVKVNGDAVAADSTGAVDIEIPEGNLINVTERFPGTNGGVYVLGTAVHAVPAELRAPGRLITYRTGNGQWETKRFLGAGVSTWETLSNWEDAFGTGTLTGVKVNGDVVTADSTGVVDIEIPGDNLINVTERFPGTNGGVYVLGTAVHAVPAELRAPGRLITYVTNGGLWETKRFLAPSVSGWETLSNWEDAYGTVKGIKVNGQLFQPGSDGIVEITI